MPILIISQIKQNIKKTKKTKNAQTEEANKQNKAKQTSKMNCERKIWLFLAMASIIVCKLEAFPSGGPKYACRSLTPGHSNGTQPGPPPYRLTASRELLEPRGRTSCELN